MNFADTSFDFRVSQKLRLIPVETEQVPVIVGEFHLIPQKVSCLPIYSIKWLTLLLPLSAITVACCCGFRSWVKILFITLDVKVKD